MSNNVKNLEKLTDQIYQEGIEKAEKQSKKMIEEALAEKAIILDQAKTEAESIIEEAQRESQRLKLSIASELELQAKQFTSDFKVKIEGLLSQKIIETTTKQALADVNFMQSVISDLLLNWKDTNDIELILPKNLEDKIKESFSSQIKEIIPNMIINFDGHLNGGFRIARKAENYQISFSDEDFINIFRSYLSEQTNKLLFKASDK